MIYAVDDGFVISSRQVWLPGCFESKRAANYGFRFDGEALQRLQDKANETNGVITFNDLRAERALQEQDK